MNNIRFLSENFQFLVVKFSIYLNRRVFVMSCDVFFFFFVFFFLKHALSVYMNDRKSEQRNRLKKG